MPYGCFGVAFSEEIKAGEVKHEGRQVEQGIPIWNNKIYRPEPKLCEGDGPIARFRQWFSQFYA